MLQEEGAANELVGGGGREQLKFSSQCLQAAVGSWRVGPAPLGISLLEVCPSPLRHIQNPAAPGSRSPALGLPSWKISIRIPGEPHSFFPHRGELWSWKGRQEGEGVLRVGYKVRRASYSEATEMTEEAVGRLGTRNLREIVKGSTGGLSGDCGQTPL